MRRIAAAAALAASLVALVGCAPAASAPAAAAPAAASTTAQLVSIRCTRCHPLDRIKAAQHDVAAWKVTVDRMRGKGGSDVHARPKVNWIAEMHI